MAAAASPETALSAATCPAYDDEEDDEELCRICRFPAEADRPLRNPCSCHGSIRFVHDDCQFRWMAISHLHRCEVCKRPIFTRPLYTADAPARLSVWEFMLGASNRIMGLLLSLFFTICVVRDSFVRLTTLWRWRLVLTRAFAQVHHLFSISFSSTSIIASIALWVVFTHMVAPFAVAPFARWVARLEAWPHGFRGFDGLQVLALAAVEGSLLVCKRPIFTRPLYAADAPARLSVWEFMLGAPNRIMGLLLSLFFTIYVVRDSFVRLTTLWRWRLVLARAFAQVHHLFSICFSTTSIIASIALWVVFTHMVAPFAVAPFARWVARLEARPHGFRGFDGLQVLALAAVEGSLLVLMVDMVLACIFGFLPFSLGRMILWCMSCFNFGNVDEADSYTSTALVLLVGYGFIFSMGVTFAGLYTFCEYLTGERLMVVIFFTSLRGISFRGSSI